MFENLHRTSVAPLRDSINVHCRARVLTKLITAELEGLCGHPIIPLDNPFDADADDLLHYIKAWVDTCIIYDEASGYTLRDIYMISKREDFDDAIHRIIPFTDLDPMNGSEYIHNEAGRRIFIEIYAKFNDAPEDLYGNNLKTNTETVS